MKHQVAEIGVSYRNRLTVTTKITSGAEAAEILLGAWNNDTIQLQEEFKVLLMNRANIVLGIYPLSKGGVTGTVVDIKLMFAVALKCNASAIIVAHNHPSGNTLPSEQDQTITNKIVKAASFLEIAFLDHLILTAHNGYFSFAENGLLIKE